jgi:glycosyltransferase involved in cell wall biosynthesis
MQRLGIDCRFGSVYGGLGTYTRSLVCAMLRRSDPWQTVLFVKSEDEPWLRKLPKNKAELIEAPFDHYSLSEQTAFPNLLQDSGCDILFFPHFNVPVWNQLPYVCTVHDLILHRFPNESGFLKRLAYRFVLSQALRHAKAVSSVSEYTKKDIAEIYGTRAAAKVSVIYPGVDPSFVRQFDAAQAEVRGRHQLVSPYLLYIGNAKEHKNVPVLIEAFRQSGLAGIELVLVTGGRESAHLRRTQGVRLLGSVPPEELPALLSGASACVTATKLEGFCLPLLEAMACGTPVVATDTGPIPEVTAGHAVLVPPDPASLAQALRTVVLHPPGRNALEAAKAHAQAFSWDRTAAGTAALLQRALHGA